MGKKSRVKTQKVTGGAGMSASPSGKEMMGLIAELLQMCSGPPPAPGKEWDEYLQVRVLVEKIRKKQKGLSVVYAGSRDESFEEFMNWAVGNGILAEGVEIVTFADEGYGLKAMRDIKADELFLWIPRRMTMTAESVKSSVLGPLMAEDRVMQAMENVALALQLLCERANPSSFWQPYIRSLPSTYDTPLYCQADELAYFRATQALPDVLAQYKSIARQYAYFYRLMQNHPAASKLPLRDSFTYDDYRWAISTVMTRQNQIPMEDASTVTLALIPLWDMCNHTNGLITTGYNMEDDRCECVALRDFKPGDQIYIFYGIRSNADFVIHNGFFFEGNANDRVKIKLGVSKSERLYAMKSEILARGGIPASTMFALHCGDQPIPAQLLAFLRTFCMTEEELKVCLIGEDVMDKIYRLGDPALPISWENEIKLWTFLETRVSLLLHAYNNNNKDDDTLLTDPKVSHRTKMAVRLRRAEQDILANVVSYAGRMKDASKKLLAENAPIPEPTDGSRLTGENGLTPTEDDEEEDYDTKIRLGLQTLRCGVGNEEKGVKRVPLSTIGEAEVAVGERRGEETDVVPGSSEGGQIELPGSKTKSLQQTSEPSSA
ncbi:actin-histidine N-methyltransferase [Petromyzon marinus]|uniref:actin-histidine N-methyltransferase n=1 Tax=Petromyzon marinus TaxID=7757 RepID=UPI003F6F70B9